MKMKTSDHQREAGEDERAPDDRLRYVLRIYRGPTLISQVVVDALETYQWAADPGLVQDHQMLEGVTVSPTWRTIRPHRRAVVHRRQP